MEDEVSGLRQLGSKETAYRYQLDPSVLDTFPNKYPDRDYTVCFVTHEFTSLCPKTGQPDFATLSIEYVPGDVCIETKSLKLFLFSFRNHHTFMETAVNTVLDELVGVAKPKRMTVKGVYLPRGGISPTVTVEYTR